MPFQPGAESADRGASAVSVRLHGRFEIRYDRPLPDYRTCSAPAFEAIDGQRRASRHFALICDPTLPIRHDAASRLRVLKSQHLLTPVELGPVDWAPARRRRLAIVYEQPIGGRLGDTEDGPIQPWSEAAIITKVLAPLLLGIAELETEGTAHRAINPANVYFRDSNRRIAMLGDCISAPPGLCQPAAYETLEAAMADPAGRGFGGPGADLYALGVLVLHLYLGRMPLAGQPAGAVAEAKLKQGSYAALIGEARLPHRMGELVRGLVSDDPQTRWRLQDLHLWLDGRRLTPKLQPPPRAAQGFELAGESCATGRHLAWVMDRVGEKVSARIMRSQAFDIWLSRTLADRKIAGGVSAAHTSRADDGVRGPAQTAQFVARVLMALDPPAPIRYRSLKVTADGFGYALAAAMLAGHDTGLLAEMLQARLPQFWAGRQLRATIDTRLVDRLSQLVHDPRPGYGVERVAYELVPGLHCLSPFVEQHFVRDAADLLGALELAAASGATGDWPLDRHIVAFLAQHEPGIDDGMLVALVHPEPAVRLLAALQLLASLQESYGPQPLPALTHLFGRQCQPAIERFRNRRTRARLAAGLAAMLQENSLVTLSQYLDKAGEQQQDALRFHRARGEYLATIGSLATCDRDEAILAATTPEAGRSLAVRLAGIVAVAIGGLSVLVMGLL